MICDECGETNKTGTEFCMFCGAFLGWQEQENPPGADDVTQVLPAVKPAGVIASATGTDGQASGSSNATGSSQTAPPDHARVSAASASSAGPKHQPTPVDLSARSGSQARATPPGCPTCDRPIDGSRRFCGHCGEQLIWPGAGAPVTRPASKRVTWWSRLWDSKDRVARRAYRRSLPPLYRWRRVIIAVLALGLIGAGLTVIGRSPKTFVMARYHDLKQAEDPVAGVVPSTIPPDSSAGGSTPEALVDNSEKPWQMTWTSTTKGSVCGEPPTTPVIQLSFPMTRIRAIDMLAGLQKKYPSRALQFRPQTIWIAYGNECHPQTLKDEDRQRIPLDTKVPVNSLRIGVITTFEQPEGSEELLSFTEIRPLARPPLK